MAQLLRLGLTGGIGCGKSTVAGTLIELGATLVDADAISRQLTAPGGLALPAIARQFGPEFITSEGALDRQRMRALAYQDSLARNRLEAIIHPLVGQHMESQVQQAQRAGATCIVFDIPLLVESARWRKTLHRLLVVDCLAEQQCERVMARSALSRTEVEDIIKAQASRSQRLAAADLVIFNGQISLAQLRLEVRQAASGLGLSCG